MKILHYMAQFLIFPGFLFSAVMGLLVGWVDRKVTARVQWRVGPPWYQNFADVMKLFYKETLIPSGASRWLFLGMPLLAMAGAAVISTMVLVINGSPRSGFVGDIIVVVYMLLVPSIALILGGFSSGNPLAALGASREMKLILSYELPFVLAMTVPVMKTGYAVRLGDIILYQQANGPVIASVSGAISFLVMLLCFQAKLGFVPFDIAEAETEITAGPYIEYSGKALAIFKIAKAILYFIAPAVLMTLYFGGIRLDAPAELAKSVLRYVGIVVLIVLIKNTNPRVRIDHAMRFFWRHATVLAAASIALAYMGL